MKRKVFAVMLSLSLGLLGACGDKAPQKQDSAVSQGAEGESVMSATVDEVKDFMMVVKDADGNFYTVTFEDVLSGAENPGEFKVGDTVNITYTGEATEVDGFTGEIRSVEKVK